MFGFQDIYNQIDINLSDFLLFPIPYKKKNYGFILIYDFGVLCHT